LTRTDDLPTFSSVMGNRLRTVFFLGLLSAIIIVIGGALFGRSGVTLAVLIAATMNFVSWFFSDRIVLSLYGARPIEREAAPEIHAIVDECAAAAGVPKPQVALIEGGAPNAFATGRSPAHGVVAVTSSLVQMLSRDELKGVVAHEIGHIKHRDTLIMAISATLAAAITHLAHMLQWAAFFGSTRDEEDAGIGLLGSLATIIFAPIAAVLIQSAISRSREFSADEIGARIAGSGNGLASALEKIENAKHTMMMGNAEPATSHLFIVSPLSSGGGMLSLFSTHPPTEERIARLRHMV
jgi:heat shock protein HtpX